MEDHITSNRKAIYILVFIVCVSCLGLLYLGENKGEFTPPFSVSDVSMKEISVLRKNTTLDGSRACTLSGIQDYIASHNFFPQQGDWNFIGKKPVSWQPDMCELQPVEATDFTSCIVEKNLLRFVILGDSNGKRYAEALVRQLSDNDGNCTEIKKENKPRFQPDATYFKNGKHIDQAYIKTHLRDCSKCESKLVICSVTDNIQVHVEYIAMEFLLDTEITTYRIYHNAKDCPPGHQCFQSNTYQEFILRQYLAGRYPDILLVCLNTHDHMRKSMPVLRADMRYLLNLIQYIVPKTTDVVFFTEIEDYLPRKPAPWRKVIFEGGYGTTEHVSLVNKYLFETLQPAIGELDSNIHGFFDIQTLSHQVLPVWSIDGVHLNPSFYTIIINYLFQTICASEGEKESE